MCRMRISNWARENSRKHSLVNQERWDEIQKWFPKQVQARLTGQSPNQSIFDDAEGKANPG